MELILIDSNKLKVILSEEEMKKYDLLDGCTLCVCEKQRFGALLDEIKRRSGFDTLDGSIYIELFESAKGGCEIFISRAKDERSICPIYSPIDLIAKDTTESIITYRFDSASALISAARRLPDTDEFESKLLCDEYGRFYLCLTARRGISRGCDRRLIFLDEYGERIKSREIRTYLSEHARPICHKNAVEQLSGL